MADLLVLTISAAFISIIFTIFIGTLALPFLDASKKDARDLFLAIKDFTLPMGSFPDRLLRPWTFETVLQIIHAETKPQVHQNVTHEVAIERIPEKISEGEDSRLISIPTQPYIESVPTESDCLDSKDDLNNLLFDTFKYQSNQIDWAETNTPGIKGDPASEVIDNPNDIVFEVNQATENEPVNYDQIHKELIIQITPPSTTSDSTDENFERVNTDLSKLAKEKETLEAYIRHVADPEGRRGLAAMSLGSLIPWMLQEHEGNTRDLRIENDEREDEIYNAKQAFEAIIIGQNLAMQEMDHDRGLAREEASELLVKNWDLRDSSEKAKREYEGRIEELRRRARTAQEAAQEARATAEEATTGVELRIQELKTAHANGMSAAALQSLQERNSIICSRRMVEDSLRDARHEEKQQHEAAMNDKDGIITRLKAIIKQLRSAATTSEGLADSEKRTLEKQLDDQRKEKDGEISTLRDQLRESKDMIKTLGEWKKKVEAEERNSHRLSDRLEDDIATLREEKERIVSGLKRNIGGLKRTIETNRVTITELGRKVTSLESGQEVKDLKSQLAEAHKQSQRLMNKSQGLRKQVQSLELETASLKKTVEGADREFRRNKKVWATQKSKLEQNLQQAKAVSERDSQGAVKKLEEEKQGLLREVEAAKSGEQGLRTKVQSLEEEKGRTAEQHQNAMNGKDQKIRDLEQTIVDNNSRLEHRMGVEVERQVKVAVDAKEVDIWNEAIQQYGDRNMEYEEESANAVKDPMEAKKRFQVHLDSERRTQMGKMNQITVTEINLRTQIGTLKSQIERYTNAAGSTSTTKADSKPADHMRESSALAREVDEANDLFEEIEEHGLFRTCGERFLLKELNKAKKAIASVKHEVQQLGPDKNDLLYVISEASINEGRFQQCDSRKRPVLLRQARLANERLQSLHRMLSTSSEVRKDAILETLQSPAMNETMVLPDRAGIYNRSVDSATARARQGQGDLIMGEASEVQNNAIPEASETGEAPRSLAEILATPQRSTRKSSEAVNNADSLLVSPVVPVQVAQQDQPPQQQTGTKGQGFAPPNQDKSIGQPPLPGLFQPPLPGLFQSRGMDQAPLPGSFPSQSVRSPRKPVITQPQGEIKMPRGITRSMRQWAKGWVRNGDIERAETLMLKRFQLLQKLRVNGLKSYLAELKRQVDSQTLDQMEQPGGWTDEMTTLVENGLNDGKDLDTIINSVRMEETKCFEMDESLPKDIPMEGIELYVKKLIKAPKSAPKPAGWTDEMTETVKENIIIGVEYVEELLKDVYQFKTNNPKGLVRYLERLQRELQT